MGVYPSQVNIKKKERPPKCFYQESILTTGFARPSENLFIKVDLMSGVYESYQKRLCACKIDEVLHSNSSQINYSWESEEVHQLFKGSQRFVNSIKSRGG